MRVAQAITVIVLMGATTLAGCHRAETLTPEAKAERGRAMLRQMSQTLGATQTFSYSSEQHRSRPGVADEVLTRDITVQRPSKITYTGDQNAAWYDGQSLTFVSHRHKAWARGPMPPTLDEAIDFLSAEYAVQMASADLLYSSPYDALMTPETQGGWVDVQNVGDTPTDHLAFTSPAVDWELWLTQDDRRVPRQMKLTYKNEPGTPSTRVVFSNVNLSPTITADTFTAKVPDGYERIKLMRHATVEDTGAQEPAPATPPANQGTTPQP